MVTFNRPSIYGLVWVRTLSGEMPKTSRLKTPEEPRILRRRATFNSNTFRAKPKELSLPTNLDKLEAKLLGVI